jgi:uncharacterized repeat protein (TIGR01451 family)
VNRTDILIGGQRPTLRRRVLLTLGVGLAAAVNAGAATYTPNTLTDPDVSVSHHVNTADGHILANGTNADTGLVSLRSAIIAANANAGADVVSLGSGTYQLQIAPILNTPFGSGNAHKAAYDDATGSKYAQNGSLDVTGPLTISGAGSGQTIIDGGSLDLILALNPFNVANNKSANTAGFAVTLSGLKLQHGKNASDDGTNGLAEGGAIWFDAGYNGAPSGTGTLAMNDVTLDHNTGNISGGGIVIWDGGTITISNSTISNNTATFTPTFSSAYGGGIWATQPAPSGTLTLNNVTLNGNQAVAAGGGSGAGGALYSSTPGTTYQINIHGGSITGNTSPGDGGGLFGDKITIDSGTVISGNTATTGNGGGVEGFSQLTINAGTVITGNAAGLAGGGVSVGSGGSITKSTITNNTAGTAGGGVYFLSGPDASTSTPAPSVTFCRISGNTATAGGNAVDSFDKLYSVTDDWLGTNVPAAGDVGAGNAVVITNAHGSGPGGNDVFGGTVTITTAAPHGFVTGQVVAIDGVGISTYDGSSGAGTGGVTVTGPTTFTFPSHLATPGASQPPSSGGAASQFSSLLTASESGSTVTMTVDTYPHGLAVGQIVRIQGISGAAGYNGEFKVTGMPNATTFTFTAGQTGLPSLSSSRIGFAYPLVNNISAATESGSAVTLTTNASFGFAVGNLISVAGVGVAGYNGTFLVTSVTPTSVSYASTQTGLAAATGGNVTKLADKLLELTASASPSTIRINQSSTVTASFLTDSANNSVSTTNLSTLIGQPITFGNPILGTLSGAQTVIQGSGTATVTFNAGGIGGFGRADATVDSGTATATIVVLQPPSIAKSFVPTFVPTNSDSALTLTVTNPNVVAIDASFTDDLSAAGLTVSPTPGVTNTCGGSVAAAAGTTSVSFSNASLPVGTCTVTANVRAATDGIKNNSVTIDSGIAGTGNTSLASLTVINPPAIGKAFAAPTIPLNGAANLTLTVTNSNTSTALAGLAFTDSLPTGLAVASPGNLNNTCGGTAIAATGSGTVSLSGGSLAASNSCTVSVDLIGNTAGVKNNSVQVTSSNAGTGNTGTASITVVAPPTIGKVFGASSIALNGSTGLTLTIQNPNASTALTGIAFVDTLPTGLVVSTPSGLANTCGGTATAAAGSGLVSLSGGTISPSASCTLSANVTGVAAGTQNNTTGAVTSTEGGTGATSNTATLIVSAPDLTVTKTHAANFRQGQTGAAYTITVTNSGSADTTGTVTVTDTLPAGLTATAFGGSGWSCLPLPSLSCSRSDVLAAGASYPDLTLTVNVALTAPGSVINTATVSGGGEGNTGNDTADDLTNIDSVTGNLYTFTQCRVLDTRKTAPIAAGATLTVAMTGGACGIPATATAVALNATATNEGAAGFLVLFPADQPRPMVSTLNFDSLKTRANNAFIRLAIDGSGAIKVFNGSAGPIDLILDINAYFQ